MKSIDGEFTFEISIKKSRFICYMKNCDSEAIAINFIDNINKLHSDATHNCICYKIGSITRVNDDGEPSGTAGLPMLEVINKNDFDNICIVVTRYFGGIKLGAGGLIRAYAKSVAMAISNCSIIELVEGISGTINMSYSDTKQVDYLIKTSNIELINQEYLHQVKYQIKAESIDFKEFIKKVQNYNHLISLSDEEKIVVVRRQDE